MNRNNILIFLIVVILISLNIFLKPYLYEREVLNTAKTILTAWQKGDIPSVYPFWQDPQKSPPIYGLVSSEIKDKIFSEKEDVSYAQIFVILKFSQDNILPSGREWVFEMVKTKYGWKILDFRLMR